MARRRGGGERCARATNGRPVAMATQWPWGGECAATPPDAVSSFSHHISPRTATPSGLRPNYYLFSSRNWCTDHDHIRLFITVSGPPAIDYTSVVNMVRVVFSSPTAKHLSPSSLTHSFSHSLSLLVIVC